MPPPLPAPDDHALVDAFRAGDEFAFVALYNRYKGPVYAFAARMLLDRDAAQDALQETFVRVYEHRERLVSAGSFRAWLFAIARNQCLLTLRRAAREEPLTDATPEPPSDQTPFNHLLRSEQADLVTRYLGQLSPEYREVLVLREYQNLSYDEIAAVTRTTVSSVKSRLFKARRALGAYLEPWGGGPAPPPPPPRRRPPEPSRRPPAPPPPEPRRPRPQTPPRLRAPNCPTAVPTSDAFCPDAAAQERLSAFADGELASAEHSLLFAHLAACPACRRQFEALLAFRRGVRADAPALAPAADEAVLARLDALRRARLRLPDRRADRRPLARALHRRVPLGTALLAALLSLGAAVWLDAAVPRGTLALEVRDAASEAGAVRFTPAVLPDGGAVYVIEPGVTVEAPRL